MFVRQFWINIVCHSQRLLKTHVKVWSDEVMREITPHGSACHEPAARLIPWFDSRTPGALICVLLSTSTYDRVLNRHISFHFQWREESSMRTSTWEDMMSTITESRCYQQLYFGFNKKRKRKGKPVKHQEADVWCITVERFYRSVCNAESKLCDISGDLRLGPGLSRRTSSSTVWVGPAPWSKQSRGS